MFRNLRSRDREGAVGAVTEAVRLDATGGAVRSASGIPSIVNGASSGNLPLVLVDIARGTGGTYVTGNDYALNFRKLSTPENYYILTFAPTAKADGKLHQLKVKLDKKGKFTVDARNSYYALERAE